jgi:hypothetical protein
MPLKACRHRPYTVPENGTNNPGFLLVIGPVFESTTRQSTLFSNDIQCIDQKPPSGQLMAYRQSIIHNIDAPTLGCLSCANDRKGSPSLLI